MLVAIALLAGAAPASAEPGVWGSSSHPSVSGRTQIFYGAIADRRNDAWAIGYSWGVIGGALEFRTLAQRWNGFSWTTIPTPDYETAPAQDLIFDADAAGPNNIYAAGIRGGAYNAMLMHWDGTAWSLVDLPSTIPSNADLSTVAVDSTGAWAMGNKYNPLSGYWQPFILHKQGATWVEVQMNATQGCEATDDDAFYRFDRAASRSATTATSGSRAPAPLAMATPACSPGTGRATGAAPSIRRTSPPPPRSTTSTRRPGARSAPSVPSAPSRSSSRARPGLTSSGRPCRRSAAAPRSTRSAPASATTPSASTPAPTRGPTRPAYRLAGGQWRSEQVSEGFGNPQAVAVDPTGQAWLMGVSVSDDFGLTMRRDGPP